MYFSYSGRPTKIRQPRWMKRVKVGSVFRNRSGTDYRVVRLVSRDREGNLHGVGFVIRHCSWTHRPTTFLNTTDIVQRGYTLVDKRVRLQRPIDKKIEKSFQDWRYRKIDCCDVKGIP